MHERVPYLQRAVGCGHWRGASVTGQTLKISCVFNFHHSRVPAKIERQNFLFHSRLCLYVVNSQTTMRS